MISKLYAFILLTSISILLVAQTGCGKSGSNQDVVEKLGSSNTKPSFPNDADGESLRLVAQYSDLSRPMTVDFHIAASTKESAQLIAQACAELLYHTDVDKDDDGPDWTITCTTRMLLSYKSVIAIQIELESIANPLGGYIDGWGTFGNE